MKVRYTTISLLFLWIICMPMSYLTRWAGAVTLISRMQVLAFVFALVIYISGNVRIYKGLWLPILFILWHLCISLFYGNDMHSSMSLAFKLFTAYMLATHVAQKKEECGLREVTYLFVIHLFLNAVTRLLPLSYVLNERATYFLGSRVNISDLLVYAISIAAIYYVLYKKLIVLLWVAILSGTYFCVVEAVSTGIMSLIVFSLVIIYFLIARNSAKGNWFPRVLVLIVFVGCLYFAFFPSDIAAKLNWLFEGFLKEDLTLNGRTKLWEIAISQIEGIHWLVGYGYANGAVFELENGFQATTAHSQYINILFRYGIIGFTLYFASIVQIIRQCMKNSGIRYRVVVIASIVSMVITGIATTTYTVPYMFIWMAMLLNVEDVFGKEDYVTSLT